MSMTNIVKDLAISALVQKTAQASSQKYLVPGLIAFTTILLIAAIIFGFVGLNQYLYLHFEQFEATLITAGAILLTALLLMLIFSFVIRKKARKKQQQISQIEYYAADILDEGKEELEAYIADNPKTSLALACIAGILAKERIL